MQPQSGEDVGGSLQKERMREGEHQERTVSQGVSSNMQHKITELKVLERTGKKKRRVNTERNNKNNF